MTTAMSPTEAIDILQAASRRLAAAAKAVDSTDWPNRTWHTERCDMEATHRCPCIVALGNTKPFDQPQIPHIQYIADAETAEHATYITLMNPEIGKALVAWLDVEAARLQTDRMVALHEKAIVLAQKILNVPAAPMGMTEENVKEAYASCPGREMDPNPCRCPCYGCQHHCSAHWAPPFEKQEN